MPTKKHTYIIYGIALIVVLLAQKRGFAQKQKNEVISVILERLVENTESTIDYTDLQAQLEYYFEHKINLNKTTSYELQQLVFLKQSEIASIFKHIEKYGNYESIYELQAVENLSEESMDLLKYFCYVTEYNKQLRLNELKELGKTEIIYQLDFDLQEKAGYKTASLQAQNKQYYLGSPYRNVLRLKQQIGKNITIGYTAEKDAGEQFFAGAQSAGYDFNSAYLQAQNWGNFKQIIVGDFQANFGQALTFSSGLSARKSAYVLNTSRNFQMIRPNRSINEFEFLRGIALQYQYKSWFLIPFVSFKTINTNLALVDSSTNPFEGFTNFSLSGLHRTNNEIADKNNINQQIIGAHIRKSFKPIEMGITLVKTNYNLPLLKGDALYQQYNFSGTTLINTGFDYKLNFNNALLLGEFSMSNGNAFANSHTLLIPIDAKLDVCLLYRNFDRNYQTTYSGPFAENSDARNETGFYTGLSFKPNRAFTINTYIDFFKSAWLRYQVDAPSKGYDVLVETQYNPSKAINTYVRYRYENKERNKPNNENDLNDVLEDQTKQQWRFHIKYKMSLALESESRIELSTFNSANIAASNGFLVFQDIKYKFLSNKMSINARLALFNIDNYNARIYAYEDNVPYTFSVPLYQNNGTRFYLVYKYQINKHIKIFLRYSQTKYTNVNTIGSGLEQINGNTQSDLITQLQLLF
jgi:hypothetical protein